ncbi:hypothetical protein LCGC14_0364910 [marine sediment metagenome]|uniref:Uncharacterized protein n=1 Tax=marine sediment metagenome TaxID=412755 RepID=A0A0F9TCR9_9ZZZZ
MYYYTKSVEMAIQCVAGNIPGVNVARLGKNVPETWEYELRMRNAKEELHLGIRQKMDARLARKYVYSHLKKKDLPEPVVGWFKEIKSIKDEMAVFNNFMNQVASGTTFKKSVLVAKFKRYFPSIKLNEKMTMEDMLNKIR